MAAHKFEFLNALSERLQAVADARTVFGDPIETEDKIVVPVARVTYGLGGGYGKMERDRSGRETVPEGGGGGIQVQPLGALEITEDATRFVRLGAGRRQWIVSTLLGLLVGYLLSVKLRRAAQDSSPS